MKIVATIIVPSVTSLKSKIQILQPNQSTAYGHSFLCQGNQQIQLSEFQ